MNAALREVDAEGRMRVMLDSIRLDGGTQPRTSINEAAVAEYAEAYADGHALPELVVFFDGTDYWLADGFHRFHAARRAGLSELVVNLKQGTQREAILYSVGANATHGLRRTNDDKRKAVRTLLDDAEWSKLSDREIARRCCVTQPFVSSLRKPGVITVITPEHPPAAAAPADEAAIDSAFPTAEKVDGKEGRPDAAAAPKLESDSTAPDGAGDEGPSLRELCDDLVLENRELRARCDALASEDGKGQLDKYIRLFEGAVRQRDVTMENAAIYQRQRDAYMRALRACGKAVGELDLGKIVRAVQSMARATRRGSA